jgi:DNA-binding NarL/FixJ family response regulator
MRPIQGLAADRVRFLLDRRLENLPGSDDFHGEARCTEDDLSEGEIEILREVARGTSNKIIAAHLSISETTVKAHMQKIMMLELRGRPETLLEVAHAGKAPARAAG